MATQFEPGRYMVKVVTQYFTKSSQKGTHGFVLTFRILCNLDQPEVPVKSVQRETVWWISKNNVKRVLHDLHTLGYPGPDLKGVHPNTAGFHDFRDQEIELNCTHETNDRRETFESWGLQNTKPKLNDPAELDEFDRLLNPGEKRVDGVAEVVYPGLTEDDVPF